MKPYGMMPKIRGFVAKVDHRIHEDNRKTENWWAEYQKPSDKRARQGAIKQINNELSQD